MHDQTTIDRTQSFKHAGPRAFLAFVDHARGELVPLLEGAELSLGRSRSCHVVIDDPAASRLQATLTWDGVRVRLVDRGSRNGTYVSGRRVRTATLGAGDVIRIGDTRLAVVVEHRGDTRDARPFSRDPKMLALIDQIESIATETTSVLLCGETGVGKEVLARHLHAQSRRAGRFVAINCATIPEHVAESTLFGHEKGAFTGAEGRHVGILEAADGGTLFLDEVAELSSRSQARLLRALETREVVRVGGTDPVQVDLRLISAAHPGLAESHSFREDLYYRIAVLTFDVPPLRERIADIEGLARLWARRAGASISAEAMEALRGYSWPGNVRELFNTLEAATVLSEDRCVDAKDLPLTRIAKRLDDEMGALERQKIVDALDECEGNQSAAARRLGISRRALIYRMEKYGLKRG